jgi:hypothetical protein
MIETSCAGVAEVGILGMGIPEIRGFLEQARRNFLQVAISMITGILAVN